MILGKLSILNDPSVYPEREQLAKCVDVYNKYDIIMLCK